MLRQRMSRKFNKIYKNAKKPGNKIPFDFEKDRVVIFSDHHKGDGVVVNMIPARSRWWSGKSKAVT